MGKKNARFLAVMSLALGVGASHAATFVPREFDELAIEADQIFVGTAGRAASRLTDRGAIVTDYYFDDVEFAKGGVPPKPVIVTMLGGTVDGYSSHIAGAPRFRPGIRYLLFVSANGSVVFPLVGGQQGIFQVRIDPTDGAVKMHDYAGHPLLVLPTTRVTSLSTDAHALSNSGMGETVPSTQISLDAFKRAIQTTLSRGK